MYILLISVCDLPQHHEEMKTYLFFSDIVVVRTSLLVNYSVEYNSLNFRRLPQNVRFSTPLTIHIYQARPRYCVLGVKLLIVKIGLAWVSHPRLHGALQWGALPLMCAGVPGPWWLLWRGAWASTPTWRRKPTSRLSSGPSSTPASAPSPTLFLLFALISDLVAILCFLLLVLYNRMS
jgi:hypothetical protein